MYTYLFNDFFSSDHMIKELLYYMEHDGLIPKPVIVIPPDPEEPNQTNEVQCSKPRQSFQISGRAQCEKKTISLHCVKKFSILLEIDFATFRRSKTVFLPI